MEYAIYAILLADIVLAYWVARELLLNTFKNFKRKKPYILRFALIGFLIAVGLGAGSEYMSFNPLYGLLEIILCPSAILDVVFIDIPHPALSGVVVQGLFIAVLNSGLYAAIGGRVGAVLSKPDAIQP